MKADKFLKIAGCFVERVLEMFFFLSLKDLGFNVYFKLKRKFFFDRDTTLEQNLTKDSMSPSCMRQFLSSLKMPFRGGAW